jgi:hypothetical protein
MDPLEREALRERLGHQMRAPHHGSRVEEGELCTNLLLFYSLGRMSVFL